MNSNQPKKKIGNYYLLSELGKGQFGTVYKAVSAEDHQKIYAIKCISKEVVEKHPYFTRLFKTEIEVMHKINSPYLMKLYETIETMNNFYLVINFCNGGDLERLVTKQGKLSEQKALFFLRQIAAGFKVLVENKIMHRDMKLANIFLHDGNAVVGDFGFARMGTEIAKTQLGTPASMAPEMLLASGETEYSNKADLWSIGVAFYQMIYGCSPFDTMNFQELKQRVRTRSGSNLHFPPNVPTSPAVRALLISLIEPDPVRRIEWTDFFSHPLLKTPIEFRSTSEIERQKRDSQRSRSVTSLNVTSTRTFSGLKEMDDREMQRMQFRYYHEKKKANFIMLSARKVRNLSKEMLVGFEGSQRLILCSVLLAKKGWWITNRVLTNLRAGQNEFNFNYFKAFWSSPECRRIIESMIEDLKIYDTFISQIQAKAIEETKMPQLSAILTQITEMSSDSTFYVDSLLKEQLANIKSRFHSLVGDKPQIDEFSISICHLHFSTYSDVLLNVDKIGNFDWKAFQASLTPDLAPAIVAQI